MKLCIVHSAQLLARDQYTRHNILKAPVKGIDNERFKQIPHYIYIYIYIRS